ncbi:hypothetical protein M0R72_18185 [Candidatus Pacearchaeota archaeon]|jgi:hypothetical protein|nr:hypothetical protein [Candidatus Pacearchaeota archaeon]
MKNPVEIGGGWKAMAVKGGGVIIQAEMGLVAVEWADLDEKGNLVNCCGSRAEEKSAPKRVVPSTGKAAIEEFLKATDMRDLSSEGMYGPIGPTVKKFRDFLKTVDVGTPFADTVGEFLLTGDQLRYHEVAALVALNQDQVTALNQELDNGGADSLEKLLEKFMVGNVMEEKAAMDESKPVKVGK